MPSRRTGLEHAGIAAGLFTATVGVLELVRTYTGVSVIPEGVPGTLLMPPWRAVSHVVLGVCLTAWLAGARGLAVRRFIRAAALVALVLCLLTFAVRLLPPASAGVLQFLARTRIIAAVHGSLMAVALLLTLDGRRPALANTVALLEFCMGAALLLGFLYGGPLLLKRPDGQVNLAASMIAAAFPVGIIAANGPSTWPTSRFAGDGVQALLLRWLLPLMAGAILLTDLFTNLLFTRFSPGLGSTFNSALALAATAAVVLYVGDIISRRLQRADAGRVASERRLAEFFEQSPVAMAVSDRRTARLQAVNAAWLRLVGASSAAQVLNRSTAQLGITADEERDRVSTASPGEGVGESRVIRVRRLDGESRVVETTTAAYQDGDQELVLACSVDVTQRVAAETDRRRLEDQLRQAQRMEAIGQLAGGIAHDFNNLLTVIIGAGEFALGEMHASRPERADVEEMVKAARRAARLTGQLLAFSRRQVLDPHDLDLNLLLAEMQRMLQHTLPENVELRIIPAERPAWVRADPGQLEQVVMNLAVNARDAMELGGTLTMQVDSVELAPDSAILPRDVPAGRFVRLSVTDTGSGMPAEVQERVFEPFFTTKQPGKGTGLGLSTVFGIVRQSGGFIQLRSAVGQGTTFSIHLPVTRGAPAPAA